MPTTPEYLTTAQIAELLGIAPDKVLAWIHSGQLVAIDVTEGRGQRPRWRIARPELDRFLARRSTAKPAKPSKRAPKSRKQYV